MAQTEYPNGGTHKQSRGYSRTGEMPMRATGQKPAWREETGTVSGRLGGCSCSASCTYLLWVWCLPAEGLAEYWTTVLGRHPCTNHQEQQPLEEVRTRWEMEVGQGASDTVCFDLGHSDRLWYGDLGKRIGEVRWGGAPWRFHWGWVGFSGQSKKIVGIK